MSFYEKTFKINIMSLSSITSSNDFLKNINPFLDQSLKGSLYRLYRRLFYILEHPSKINFLVCLVPSKLTPPYLKTKILYFKYELDALWLLKLLGKADSNLNYYAYLNYKIYYTLKNVEYKNFIVSFAEIQEIILKDQYCAQEFLKPESIVLDCGANIGMFSLWAHHLSPKSQIYSFEPTKSTFEILEKNIKENSLETFIHSFNLALGDKNQSTSILISQDNLGSVNTIFNSDFASHSPFKYEGKQPVSMTTIDDFVKENKLERVDFIKMDTEGYEKPIIKGARETIKKFHPVIACSAYHLPKDKEEIPKLVLEIESNYQYRLEKRLEEDFIFWYKR